MKKYLITIIIFLFVFTLLKAQDYPGGYNSGNSGNKGKKVSAYFYFDLKFLKMTDVYGTEFGGGVGVLFHRKLGLDVEYFTLLSNNIRVQVNDTTNFALGLGYGGFELSYSFYFLNIIKLTPAFMTGVGRVTNSYQNVVGVSSYSNDDWFFVLEPRVKVDIRLFKDFMLELFAGERMPLGLKYYNIGNEDLTNVFFGVGIMFLR